MKVASTVLNGSVRGRPLARPLTTQPRQFAQVGEPAQRNCLAKRALAWLRNL